MIYYRPLFFTMAGVAAFSMLILATKPCLARTLPAKPAASPQDIEVKKLMAEAAALRSQLAVLEGHLTKLHGMPVPGPVGLTGPVGKAGPQGTPGATGAVGPQGWTGPVGHDGPRGPQGDRGPRGPQGDKGSTGLSGSMGNMGPNGPDGSPGPMGP